MQDVQGCAAEMAQWHHRRRANMPEGARRVPNTEALVFGAPLAANDPNAMAPLYRPDELGKRALC